MINKAISILTSPSVDLNELIELQASQQTGTVPPNTHFNLKNSSNGNIKQGKVYQKTRKNNNKRHD